MTKLKKLLVATSTVASVLSTSNAMAQDWTPAGRTSAAISPLPEKESRAVVQVLAARTVRWRKYFAVHSWIATKEKDAKFYRVYQVIGWRLRRGQDVVSIETDLPDRKWFGHLPELIYDLRGPKAEAAIPKIHAAALSYPYPDAYRAWPGPNSNTFVSHIIRNTPEIGVELPPTAIGKDWMGKGDLVGLSESKTGVQFSLFGLLGMTLGLGEGVEVNLLGLSFGVDVLRPAIKLPLIGRLGFPDASLNQDEDSPETATAKDPISPEKLTEKPAEKNLENSSESRPISFD